MEILYQDSGIVVCRKEAGMDSETDVPQALQAQLGVSVLPVHRLDRGTAGLMVFAFGHKKSPYHKKKADL